MNDNAYVQFAPAALAALTDDELDALPFGVIALGEGGAIVRYNLAEARFARLDRSAVVGRSFFGEIARCTATPDFQGRFDVIAAAPETTSVRFEFVFAFRFGAQTVEVDMGRAAGGNLVYLCVNRRKFLPRQRDGSPSIEAPLIAELEPAADAAVVVRDARARRHVDLDVTFVDAVLRGLAQLDEPACVLREIGVRWGRYAIVDLETAALEEDACRLADHTMVNAMKTIASFVERQQLGRVSFDFSDSERGFFSVAVHRNVFAEAVSHPGCAMFEGFFASLFSHLAGRPIVARETACQASGVEGCSFLCVAASRGEALERTLDGRNRSPREVADALVREGLDG